MTDEEKRQQKAMLLLESQEADDDLAHLREKANQQVVKLREVAQWLEDMTGEGYSPDILAQKREERERKISGSAEYGQALNFQRVIDLVNEIKQARKKRAELHTRKAALGLR
jgi:hypothetical protein